MFEILTKKNTKTKEEIMETMAMWPMNQINMEAGYHENSFCVPSL